MAKIPHCTMNVTAQVKELEKAIQAALRVQYPNCIIKAESGQVGFNKLDPPALQLIYRGVFQIKELDSSE